MSHPRRYAIHQHEHEISDSAVVKIYNAFNGAQTRLWCWIRPAQPKRYLIKLNDLPNNCKY